VRVSTSGHVAEAVAALQAVLLGHAHVHQLDVGLPDRSQRGLSLHHGGVVAGRALLHHEAAHVAVLASCPDQHHVGERAIADPALPPVQHVLVAVLARLGLQHHGVRAVLGLGQREGADLLERRHPRQPALALLVGAEHVDRLHG